MGGRSSCGEEDAFAAFQPVAFVAGCDRTVGEFFPLRMGPTWMDAAFPQPFSSKPNDDVDGCRLSAAERLSCRERLREAATVYQTASACWVLQGHGLTCRSFTSTRHSLPHQRLVWSEK